MNTPICDFVAAYAASSTLRLHMPGHKGVPQLGCEALDLTEIDGADNLFEPTGIIRESEANASALFGCPTIYSTEGSSLCIRAMLHLAYKLAKARGQAPTHERVTVLAGRNAHRVFVSAAGLLDMDVRWLYPSVADSYLSCPLTAADVEAALCEDSYDLPAAVYLTSPDYLGHILPISEIAEVCHRYGVLLLVDNAHGAYLRFMQSHDTLSPDIAQDNTSLMLRHPMDAGADMVCDSAHKTLPVLTGGAYLHISPSLPTTTADMKRSMALFASTSPSYLILQSLDMANRTLSSDYTAELSDFVRHLSSLRSALSMAGYTLLGEEPLKLTILAKPYGYTGTEMASYLSERGIISEFFDPDHLVLMLTPSLNRHDLAQLSRVLLDLPRRPPITDQPPLLIRPQPALRIREALLARTETIPATAAEGYILANTTVSCPPAVPIVVSGERIDRTAVEAFAYYGIESCVVVAE